MIWLLDTDMLGYLINRASGSEHIKRRLSGRSPGEVRVSAITLSEVQYGLARGDVSLERVVRAGVPVKEILLAERSQDLVVLVSHRKSLLGDMVLGTTAERVLRHSRTPLLVMPSR